MRSTIRNRTTYQISLGRWISSSRTRATPSDDSTVIDKNKKKLRWSAKLDFARLLMIMFGTPQARADYVESRQLPTRAQLDDTRTKSLKIEYWIKVANAYCDSSVVVTIDVDNDEASLYLREKLSARYRVAWSASKLREHFRELRADYEGSVEYDNYKRSGQNGPLFYPDFQKGAPTHVMLHYLLAHVPRGAVLGDLPDEALVDTNDPDVAPNGIDIDLSRTPEKQSVPKRGRRRPRAAVSPASSMCSSVSKSSGSKDNGMVAFTKTCQTLLERLQQTVEANANPTPVPNRVTFDSIDHSDQSLRLVLMKQRLKKTLRTLVDTCETDDDHDSIKLLRMRLKTINTEIAKQIE